MEINLVIKVQQFEDKRIAAKASWNIKELKGKLSEIYPTVSVLFCENCIRNLFPFEHPER